MYFVTICTKDRKNILSAIEKNMICDISKKDVGADASVCPKLTEIGDIVNTSIYNVEKIYENVKIEANIIMPNHIHMIIKIGRTEASAPTKNNTGNKISINKKM